MGLTSRTGLCATPSNKTLRPQKLAAVQLRAFARPAPFILKPFAGLYNPYPYGCSLLCNHPTDTDAKDILQKARDNWASEGKNVLLAAEIDAIRAGIDQLQCQDKLTVPAVDSGVPEELFRRYTETDSRPLTPAPTLASAATRGSRRCFTPDPPHTNAAKEKTLLVLDLRRSHSQETLSWQAGSSSLQNEPPIIRIQRVATRQCSVEDHGSISKGKLPINLATNLPRSLTPTPLSNRSKKKVKENVDEPPTKEKKDKVEDGESNDDEDNDEFVKRRGKKRRKKREGSRGPPPFQNSIDPETQVAAIGPDSHNASARPSLVPGSSEDNEQIVADAKGESEQRRKQAKIEYDSFLSEEILKQLRRELNEEVVDNEFNYKRRKALQEALKTVEKDKEKCSALINLEKELKLAPLSADLWLNLPRSFTRLSAQFELPMDSRALETMTPLEYVSEHVMISSARKLLYNCIFNKFKRENEMDESERLIVGKDLQAALNLMMGTPMKSHQESYFSSLIGWQNDDLLSFQTFCGVCAVCERLLAPEYCPQFADRQTDPCHEIEAADFQALDRKLHGKSVNANLIKLLNSIKTL